MMMRPVAIDLFAGAGGLSLGLEQAGFDVVAAVEKDPVHALVHKYNFPDAVVICEDLSSLTPRKLLRSASLEAGEVDLLAGGPPCQGFSFIGPREAGDARNSLIFEFVRMVRGINPKYVMMENVEGLVRGDMAGIMGALIEAFDDAGYDLHFPLRVMNAANYGVPQVRKRIFLIGARRGMKLADYPLLASVERRTVRDAIGDLPCLESYPELYSSDCLVPKYGDGTLYSHRLRGVAEDPFDFSRPREWDGIVTGFRRARHRADVVARFRNTDPGELEAVSHFPRLSWSGQAPTLRAGSGREHGSFSAPRPIHPNVPRCICVREAARLHGFPDWFGFHTTIWHGFRQVGNSVPPRLARLIGAEIARALGVTPARPAQKVPLGDPAWLRLPESSALRELSSKSQPNASRAFPLAEAARAMSLA